MRFISLSFLFSADKRGRCGTFFLSFFFKNSLVLQFQIKQLSCFKSEGPSFALHKKTGEGGDTDYISLYNVQGKTKSFLSTSERLRLGGVGVNCVGVMTRKDKGGL